jgi:adenylosuccinate synthase
LAETTSYDDFPQELKNYVLKLEAELDVSISMVSVGPDRNQTILR